MMYSVRSQSLEIIDGATKILAHISIDPLHPIFEGHFPGQPVLPGVCMMQIVRELMTTALSTSLILGEASSVKFLSVLNPLNNADVTVEIAVSAKESGYHSTSRIYAGDMTFFKMQAVFRASLPKLPGRVPS
jgi:3-hydroxyacyl-[acyl-carrier-protein] dehydratase